jgi:hypothetical protein
MKSPLVLDWSAISQSPAAINYQLVGHQLSTYRRSGGGVGIERRPSSVISRAQASGRNFRTQTSVRPNVDYRFLRNCVTSRVIVLTGGVAQNSQAHAT